MGDRFLIKYRGQVVGEATFEQLRQQAERGQITPLHKLSTDGNTWRYASEYAGLFGQAAPTPAPAVANQAAAPVVATQPVVTAQPAPALEPEWYILVGEERSGPFQRDAAIQFIRDGHASSGAFVWCDTFDNWQPIERVFRREINRQLKQRKKEERERLRQQRREEKRKRRPNVPPEEQSWSMLAIASVAFSVAWILGLGSVAGVLLGIFAAHDIWHSKGYTKGMGFAVAGISLGVLGMILGAAAAFFLL